MQGFLSRIISITSYSILILLLVLVAFNLDSNFKHSDQKPTIEFSITQTPTVKYSTTFLFDESSIRFNLAANLSPLASWNTKTFYFYILVELYEGNKLLLSTIIHDWSLSNKFLTQDFSFLKIESPNQMSRFTIKDIHKKLLGANLKITIHCIRHKLMGWTESIKLYQTNYTLPSKYSYDEEQLHRIYNEYKP